MSWEVLELGDLGHLGTVRGKKYGGTGGCRFTNFNYDLNYKLSVNSADILLHPFTEHLSQL